jgi:D-threonate/D-erythronate kinase
VVTRLPDGWPADAEVLSVDLDVRERSNADAARAVAHAIRQLGASDARLFVKIDSTLRGPIVGLVEGALVASGRSRAIVAPAFPEQGRHIRDGRLVVDGRVGANLSEVLGHLNAVVIDAEDTAPLRQVARASRNHPEWLLVGSAGLARQLAPSHVPIQPRTGGQGPILIVAGSPTSITREQIKRVSSLSGLVVLATPETDTRDQGQAAAALAESVADWAREHTPRAAILTGGATAREVSHGLGATSLRLVGELQPGIPLGTLEDGVWHGITVVTKAGGFGTPETLLDVARGLGVSSPTTRA